uniref:Uncharacterized protein n=1 Tax=Dunaliella tertiolecta TaxID=3047 RepID=A0A7S3QT88_DUNTE
MGTQSLYSAAAFPLRQLEFSSFNLQQKALYPFALPKRALSFATMSTQSLCSASAFPLRQWALHLPQLLPFSATTGAQPLCSASAFRPQHHQTLKVAVVWVPQKHKRRVLG